MGWGRTILLGEIGNRLDIADCERSIADLRVQLWEEGQQNVSQAETLRRLVQENDELKLYLSALARLLISKGVLSRDELMRIVDAVDRKDGRSDGKVKGEIV